MRLAHTTDKSSLIALVAEVSVLAPNAGKENRYHIHWEGAEVGQEELVGLMVSGGSGVSGYRSPIQLVV
jgi:hypothetical protein